MEHNPKVQLICVGPVIDLYGKFAALKFARMMEVYPGRVYSKPEFTALPPYIFSGADFALMPSRDEPFGLVAVEFGRKGALCVGAKVGGLGQMPGWWFTIESTTTKHVIQQFKIACQGALASKPDVRAIMRARAAKQRFPVAQWVEDLEKLQSTAIEISQKQVAKTPRQTLFSPSGTTTPRESRWNTPVQSRKNTPTHSRNASRNRSRNPSRNVSRANSPTREESPAPPLPNGGLGSRLGPGQSEKAKRLSERLKRRSGHSAVFAPETEPEDSSDEEVTRTPRRQSRLLTPSMPSSPQNHSPQLPSSPRNVSREPGRDLTPRENKRLSSKSLNPQDASTSPNAASALIKPSPSGSTLAEDWFPDSGNNIYKQKNDTLLSLAAVTGGTSDYKLQHVSPFFTDPKQEFTDQYTKKLTNLNGKTSEDALCIEEYLVKSEKQWFGQMRAAQMGKSAPPSPAPSIHRFNPASPEGSIFEDSHFAPRREEREEINDEFLLGPGYVAPKGLKHILRLRIGEWPLYSILLAFVSITQKPLFQSTSLISRMNTGPNHSGKLLPNHPPHRLRRSSGRKTLHHRDHLPRRIDNVVVPIPTTEDSLCPLATVLPLRHRLLLHRYGAARFKCSEQRLDPERSHRILCYSVKQRKYLLCREFRRRRYAQLPLPSLHNTHPQKGIH